MENSNNNNNGVTGRNIFNLLNNMIESKDKLGEMVMSLKLQGRDDIALPFAECCLAMGNILQQMAIVGIMRGIPVSDEVLYGEISRKKEEIGN